MPNGCASRVQPGRQGETLIDAGASVAGSVEAGLRIAEAAWAASARRRSVMDARPRRLAVHVAVRTSQPVLACLGSQYAGWSLSIDGYFAWAPARRGRSPASSRFSRSSAIAKPAASRRAGAGDRRAAAARGGREGRQGDRASRRPSSTILYAPTQSLAGTVQIVARVLEVALHKAHALGFPLDASSTASRRRRSPPRIPIS